LNFDFQSHYGEFYPSHHFTNHNDCLPEELTMESFDVVLTLMFRNPQDLMAPQLVSEGFLCAAGRTCILMPLSEPMYSKFPTTLEASQCCSYARSATTM